MEQVIKKERRKKDKVVLTTENEEKVLSFLSLFDKWFGVINITPSDIVNFIISERKNEFSTNEIKTLLKAMVNRNEKPKERKPRQKKAISKGNTDTENTI